MKNFPKLIINKLKSNELPTHGYFGVGNSYIALVWSLRSNQKARFLNERRFTRVDFRDKSFRYEIVININSVNVDYNLCRYSLFNGLRLNALINIS